jgi:hypothetical protein
MEETNSENTDISSSQGIDVKDVNALAKTDFVPEPFWRRVGNEIVTGLIQFGLFLLGIILDIFKALWTLISGIFIYLYKGIIAIGHFFRKAWRIFKEVDGWGRGGFVISGLGQMKYGQIYDGLIFLAVEALFILYFVTIGITSLQNLVNLSTGYKQSPKNLVLGILTIIITLSAFFVHCKSVQGMYDDYQILHNFQFLQAHEDQLHVLRNRHHYSDIDFYHESALSIRKKFRHQYGYSWLSSTYISYVPFKRLRERKPSAIRLWWNGLVDKLDARYNAVVLKVKNGKWSSAFANVLTSKCQEIGQSAIRGHPSCWSWRLQPSWVCTPVYFLLQEIYPGFRRLDVFVWLMLPDMLLGATTDAGDTGSSFTVFDRLVPLGLAAAWLGVASWIGRPLLGKLSKHIGTAESLALSCLAGLSLLIYSDVTGWLVRRSLPRDALGCRRVARFVQRLAQD